MERYLATFHTHVSALMTARTLKQSGINAELSPVPRRLSSSCGTCVRYESGDPALASMDQDVERVYRVRGEADYEELLFNP